METLYYSSFQSPVGPLTITVSEKGLVRLDFGRVLPESFKYRGVTWVESAEKTRRWVRELEQYFAGKLRRFSLPLDLRGTIFQRKCWRALLRIPYGKTRSYGDIARAVGSPQAFRAVGMANHSNPIAIVVPCHRVIASDGTLGGYGGGLPFKERLLKLEGAEFKS